ncbi:MAG: M48 family metallopeptidase [Polyangiales bacterium]
MVEDLGESAPLTPSPTPGGGGFRQGWGRTLAEAGAVVAVVALVALGLRGCADRVTAAVVERLPPSVDARVGEAAAEAQRAARMSPAPPEASARVQRVFDELRGSLTTEERGALTALRVTTERDDEVNAFALPGGETFVLTGLTDRLRGDDDALRGVLAHELGHAVRRHGVRSMVRARVYTIAIALFAGSVGDVSVTLVGAASSLEGLRYSRAMEDEADAFAVELLGRSGRSAEGLARFLESLERAPVPVLLSTHPDSAARARAIRSRTRRGGSAPGSP